MRKLSIVSVVGARPQFIKAAPVSRALRERHDEILVHSGQHYDYEMSDVFFEQLGIPRPDYNLAVGSGSHARQTGEMMPMLEELFVERAPDLVLVYGDTNTTLAGALAASKIGIPIAHVEAGLRSYNRSMPEEINRVLVDHVSELLFCPTRASLQNLGAEGITSGVHLVGDVMLDTARFFADEDGSRAVLEEYGVRPGEYYLATVHRAGNSDNATRLAAIVDAFARLDKTVLWALHPRTKGNLENFGLVSRVEDSENIVITPPMSYVHTVSLLSDAAVLLTDSGGMQKEAFFFGVPCVTLREETEWVETVESGWNQLAGADTNRIVEAVADATCPTAKPEVYGDGHASEAIVAAVEKHFGLV
ncbi:MAG: UDP-N-acetylglucosamine 2-epimerase (non-hydrolyzing) [Coriobacteriia bacterium]|nr:UDP-N-acetylglucosamine 2-epimerase (non-hydrolyzing) [Coriobacteriia bacterium]